MQKCETFTMTSTFTARGVTFITHKAKKGRTFADPAWRAHAPVWPHMHIFSQTKRHTQTLESKGLTFANGINPNKETSCFLEHNTAKLLFGAQAVNTRKSQNQFIVHRCTCVSVQRVSVSGNAAGCAFKCRCTRLSLSVAAARGVCARVCGVRLRDGKEGGRADDRVGFSDSLECEAAFTALSEQPEWWIFKDVPERAGGGAVCVCVYWRVFVCKSANACVRVLCSWKVI